MPDQPRFVSASTFALDAFADIFTRSFEAYFYEGTTTTAHLAERIRDENIDLYRSLVMLVDDEPAGQAVLALRGDQAWCGGFGVLMAFRGRGLAHQLAEALRDQARQAGARRLSLEVLTRNDLAIKAYARAGLQVQRDLLVLEWRGADAQPIPARVRNISAAAPEQLLEYFAALHPVPAAWQRDHVSLLVGKPLEGLMVERDGRPAAYVLFAVRDDTLRIVDIGAQRADDVHDLLGALQERAPRVVDVNEPADSPLIPAFQSAGFIELDRQHEMAIDLV